MSVEGIPQREQVVTFAAHYFSYNPGENACFTVDEAQALEALGVTQAGPPRNYVVPFISQNANLLSSTTGEWSDSPTSYAYIWRLNGTTVGAGTTYTITRPDDVGSSATCVVTATNTHGSTAAPPSNAIVVT
jgi:hypothetical protein